MVITDKGQCSLIHGYTTKVTTQESELTYAAGKCNKLQQKHTEVPDVGEGGS
jgi:hypothetical protein